MSGRTVKDLTVEVEKEESFTWAQVHFVTWSDYKD